MSKVNRDSNIRLFVEGISVDLIEGKSLENGITFGLSNVKDISKKHSTNSKSITVAGSTRNQQLFNFIWNPKNTGQDFFNVLPFQQTFGVYNNLAGLTVTAVSLQGNTMNTIDGSILAVPITSSGVQYSYHNQIDFTNPSVTVSGSASGYVVYKVNGSIIQTNQVNPSVHTYLFPADKYLYSDVLEVVFQSAFQPYAGNSFQSFNPKKKARAVVLADGQQIMSGWCKLVSATNKNNLITFDLQIMSDIAGLTTNISNQRLEDLYTTIDINGNTIDLPSPFDHQFVIENITDSWFGGRSNVCYPLADYGNDSTPIVTGTSWYTSNFRPALRLMDYWDKIFSLAGFTYESNFLNSQYVRNLILPFSEGNIAIIDKYPVEVQTTGSSNIVIPLPYLAEEVPTDTGSYCFNNVISDPFNVYDPVGLTYNPPLPLGTYQATTQITCTMQVNATTTSTDLLIPQLGIFAVYEVYNSDGTFVTAKYRSLFNIPAASTLTFGGNLWFNDSGTGVTSDPFNISFPATPVPLSGSQYIKVKIAPVCTALQPTIFHKRVGIGNSDGSLTLNIINSSTIKPDLKIQVSSVIDGSWLRYKDFAPKNFKSIELISSVIKLFNLIPEQDKDQENHIRFFTRDEYFSNQKQLNWDKLIDSSAEIKIRPIPELDAATLLFQYKTSDTWFNKLYSSLYGGQNYGSVKITGYQFSTSEKSVLKELAFTTIPSIQFPAVQTYGETTIEIVNLFNTGTGDCTIFSVSGYYAANGNTYPTSNINFSGNQLTNIRVGMTIIYQNVKYLVCTVFNPYSFAVTKDQGSVTDPTPVIVTRPAGAVNGDFLCTNDIFQYNTNSNVIIPSFAESSDNGVSFKPHKGHPSILFYKTIDTGSGNTSTCNPYYVQYTPIEVGGYNTYWSGSDSGIQVFNQYAFASHMDDPNNPQFDLLFGQPVKTFFPINTYPTKSLFSKYWINTVEEIIDESAKFVEAEIKLSPVDVANLSLNNIVSIKNSSYRINEVKEYRPDASTSTKVELVKIPQIQFQTIDPPIIDAGNDRTIQLPATSLNFAGSAQGGDPGVIIEKTIWQELSGPISATISNTGSLTSLVSGLGTGSYVFQLTGIDNYGFQASDTMGITVTNHTSAPTVNAGIDQTVIYPTTTANLVGTATGNAGATIASTLWTQTAGPSATITTPTSLNTSVTGFSSGSTYSFTLSATDNFGLTESDSMNVSYDNVKIQNFIPTASITAVAGIAGLTPAFPGLTGFTHYDGQHTGFTGAIEVTVAGIGFGSSCSISLNVNGIDTDCKAVTNSGNFFLGSGSYTPSDAINITFVEGTCGGTTSSTTSTSTTSTSTTSTTSTSTTTTTTAPPTLVIEGFVGGVNITALSGIPGVTPAFTGQFGPGSYSGYHGGFTGTISAVVGGTIPLGSHLSFSLFKNGVLTQCINVLSGGSKTFASNTYTSTDGIIIQIASGPC